MQLEVILGSTKVNWASIDGIDGTLELSGDVVCSFNQFLKIVSDEEFNLIPEKYVNMTSHFVSSSYAAPLLIPRQDLKLSLSRAEKTFKEIILEEKNQNYLESWIQINQFLTNMKRIKIDVPELIKLMGRKHEGSRKSFESFLPAKNGLTKKISYNMARSSTGRLTVNSGPQILTTDAEVRKCFRSVYEGGTVYSVDFTSIEPRIGMIVAGKIAGIDLYQDILDEFPDLTRDSAKIITLTALYGGSDLKVSESIGNLKLAKKAISFVKYNFGIDELEKRLDHESENGILRNAIGRPLREATKNKRVRINHYLQSSAAEISILLFSQLCKSIPERARPVYVIHDALIIDVPSDIDEQFKIACNSIFWKNIPMPVKIENLTPTYEHE